MNDFQRLAEYLAALVVENSKLREQLTLALTNQKKPRGKKASPPAGESDGV